MSSVFQIFQDPKLNEQFDKIGCVVLPSVNESAIDELEVLFRTTDGEQRTKQGWYNSSHDKQLDANLIISRGICDIFQTCLGPNLPSYRATVGAFLVKRGSQNGEVIPHADWAMLDECQGISISAFIPLCDLDSTTGWVTVIPGSHKLVELNRGYAPGRNVGWAGLEALMMQYAQPIRLKRGAVLLFDHRLVHYSPAPTQDDVERIVANCSFLPERQPALHFSECLFDRWGSIYRVHQVDESFYLDPNRRLHPAGYYAVIGYRRQPPAKGKLEEAEAILSTAIEMASNAYPQPS
jgi:hypothetical protein